MMRNLCAEEERLIAIWELRTNGWNRGQQLAGMRHAAAPLKERRCGMGKTAQIRQFSLLQLKDSETPDPRQLGGTARSALEHD